MEKSCKVLKHRINPKLSLQFIFTLFLFAFITLQILSKSNNYFCTKNPLITPIKPVDDDQHDKIILSTPLKQKKPVNKCDLFTGQWIFNPEGPYYTNNTCGMIQEYQNCLKLGRLDTDFMKLKWKPDECDLPTFDQTRFLSIVKDKSLAFVGDSLARNQMQSLICLLYRVEQPQDVSNSTDDHFKRYYYQEYNFTLAVYWSPYLVKTQKDDPDGKPSGSTFEGLFLDEADLSWAAHISEFNYIIVSAGHWFIRPVIYREKAQLMGCLGCDIDGLKEYSFSYGYETAFKTALRAIFENEDFKGNVYLRTFSPSHFEGGTWDNGGDCVRKTPFKRGEIDLEGVNLEAYKSQINISSEAQKLAHKRGIKFGLMDVTRIMLLRRDGHPGMLAIPANVTWPSDCLHWCLPGPVDTWNEFLLEMLRVG